MTEKKVAEKKVEPKVVKARTPEIPADPVVRKALGLDA